MSVMMQGLLMVWSKITSDNQGDNTFTIEDADDYNDDWYIDLETNGSDVRCKIDTGAQANVLPLIVYRCLLKKLKLHKSNPKLTSYNGTTIKVLDKCKVSIPYKGKKFPVLFIVANTKSKAILGLGTCKRLNFVQRMYQVDSTPAFLEEFEDCFGELGNLPKEYHIVLDPTVPPVVDLLPMCYISFEKNSNKN